MVSKSRCLIDDMPPNGQPDQSVSIDPCEQGAIRHGSMRLVIESKKALKSGKILCTLPIPSRTTDPHVRFITSDLIAFEMTHARRLTFKHYPSPAQAHSFRSVLLKGAINSWSIPPDGLGEIITVLYGEVWVVVARPSNRNLVNDLARPDYLVGLDTYNSHVSSGQYEAVVLSSNEIM